MRLLYLPVLLLLKGCFIQVSGQDQLCSTSVDPIYAIIRNATDFEIGSTGCTQIDTGYFNCTEGVSAFRVKESFVLEFYFENIPINRVELRYTTEPTGLLLIVIEESSLIRTAGTNGTHYFAEISAAATNGVMKLTFDVTLAEGSSFEFQTASFSRCGTSTVSTATIQDSTATNTEAASSGPDTFNALRSLIVGVTVTISCLLLLVFCAIFGLIFILVFKKKKKESFPLRIHSLGTNTYETPQTDKDEETIAKKQESSGIDGPRVPTDPEYATLSEWREMNEKPVQNPFYDTSSSAIDLKAKAVEVPQLEWSSSAWDSSHPAMVRRFTNNNHIFTNKAHSMQDMRSYTDSYDRSDSSASRLPNLQLPRRSDTLTPPPAPQQSSPPPLPSMPPPPPPLSASPRLSRPPLPPSKSKKGKVGVQLESRMSFSDRQSFDSGNSASGVSPLVHNKTASTQSTGSQDNMTNV